MALKGGQEVGRERDRNRERRRERDLEWGNKRREREKERENFTPIFSIIIILQIKFCRKLKMA